MSTHSTLAYRLAGLKLSVAADTLLLGLERRYRPDQPRAPRGTPIGGQWIDESAFSAASGRDDTERIIVAGGRCDGFSAGCQNGGSFGSSAIVNVEGKMLCWDCAIKFFGIQKLSPKKQLELLKLIDPRLR